jgi:hypothetical protein
MIVTRSRRIILPGFTVENWCQGNSERRGPIPANQTILALPFHVPHIMSGELRPPTRRADPNHPKKPQ